MITYREQLESSEWRSKRKLILERDNFRCRKCNIQRSPFIGLSQKFGIKGFSEMKDSGYSLSLVDHNVFVTINNVIATVNYIETENVIPDLEKLYYAKRWKDPKNIFVFGSYEIICFRNKLQSTDRFSDLNIHHKYYIENRKAWEYNDDALITLCENCHRVEHETNSVSVLDENGQILYTPEICDRCGGSGYLPEFNHCRNGICFKCGGDGVILK